MIIVNRKKCTIVSFCICFLYLLGLTACQQKPSTIQRDKTKTDASLETVLSDQNTPKNSDDLSEPIPPYFSVDLSGTVYDTENLLWDKEFQRDMEKAKTTAEIVDCLSRYVEKWDAAATELTARISPLLSKELQQELTEEQTAYQEAVSKEIRLFNEIHLQTMGSGSILPIQTGYASFYRSRQNALSLGEMYFLLTGNNYWDTRSE